MVEYSDYQRNEVISDEVQEIISYRPHWIVRKGNLILFLIITSLFSLTWLIKYPDIINASAKIVALNPPKLVNSKAEGKLLQLFVSDEQVVTKGQHMGVIESTADYEEVMKLKIWIDFTIESLRSNDYEILQTNKLPLFLGLGELQVDYQLFQNELFEAKQTLSKGYYEKKKSGLQKDLQYLGKLKVNTIQQLELIEQDHQLQKAEYDAYAQLQKEKVIAQLELNQYKSKLIAKDQNLKQIDAQLTAADLNAHSKEKELLDLRKVITDEQQKFYSTLLDLKSQIEKWIQQYVVIAPETGKAIFIAPLQPNELITTGQGLFYIIPEQSKFYSEVMASQKGLGKVKINQLVKLNIESYPNNEFGYIIGKVEYISTIPNRRDSFLIKLGLPRGLKTNYGKEVYFRNNLLAQAEIITDNKRLFDRFTGQLKQIWNK